MIEAIPNSAGVDEEVPAIEAGAQDFEPAENGATLFITDATIWTWYAARYRRTGSQCNLPVWVTGEKIW